MADNKIELDKIEFKNLPSGNTPVNDENLNQVQENVEKFGNVISKSAADNLSAEAKRAADKEKELENKIKTVEEKNEDLQDEINFLNSEFADNTVNGESVVINDGLAKSKIKADVNGNSYQETTEGYNEIDYTKLATRTTNNTTCTNNNDGSFTINGTASNTTDFYFYGSSSEYVDLFEIGTNKISGWVSGVSGGIYVVVKHLDETTTVYTENGKGITFEKVEGDTFRVFIRTVNGTTYNNVLIKPMIYKYEGTDKPFEKYTNGVATPNTEYKQDIEVITECSLVQRGINKLDKENNLELGVIGNTIGNDRVLTPSNTRVRTKVPIKVKPNTVYTISVNSGYVISIREYNAEGKIVFASTEWTTSNTFTLTTTATTNSFDIIFSRKDHSTITLEEIEWCQFVEGTEQPYEPYIEPIVHSIDLAGNSIAKVGQIADLLNIGVDGSVKIGDKVIKEYIFTGDETFTNVENGNGLRYFTKTNFLTDNNSVNVLCSRFKAVANMWNLTERIDCIKPTTNLLSQINIMSKDFTDNVEFQTYLKELYNTGNPVKILYVTTIPETITLPSIEPITLFEGTNVFELVTNLGTTLAVTYKQSNRARLDNLEKAILSLGGNI